MYLVDYDIPAERRHKFYYDLRREVINYLLDGIENTLRRYKKYALLKRLSLQQLLRQIKYTKSSQSVILTSDEGLAKIVFFTAVKYGKANIYQVRKIESL